MSGLELSGVMSGRPVVEEDNTDVAVAADDLDDAGGEAFAPAAAAFFALSAAYLLARSA